jgi:hypothetical protein
MGLLLLRNSGKRLDNSIGKVAQNLTNWFYRQLFPALLIKQKLLKRKVNSSFI